MIRDAVIHLLGEQPLVADLPTTPVAGDLSLICTNLRTLSRKRPVFVDDSHSLFVFPYAQIRFVEIPQAARTEPDPADRAPLVVAPPADIGLDEDFLRRVRDL